MDTRAHFQKVLAKKRLNAPVDIRDVAVVIANSPDDMFEFVANNDVAQLWKLIHDSGAPSYIGENMGFKPDAKRALAELKQLYIRQDYKDLSYILSRFRINMNTRNYTTDADLIDQLESIGEISMKDGGYAFKLDYNG